MGPKFLKIAVVYFVLAIVLGIAMGITEQFQLTPVHAHLNLLGWVSSALFGLIYARYPDASQNKLAKIHFWLHNIGLPLMQGSLLVIILTNNHTLVLLAIIGSLMIVIGAILFAVNLFKNI